MAEFLLNAHDFELISFEANSALHTLTICFLNPEANTEVTVYLRQVKRASITNWASHNVAIAFHDFDASDESDAFIRACELLNIDTGVVSSSSRLFYLDPTVGVEMAILASDVEVKSELLWTSVQP